MTTYEAFRWIHKYFTIGFTLKQRPEDFIVLSFTYKILAIIFSESAHFRSDEI